MCPVCGSNASIKVNDDAAISPYYEGISEIPDDLPLLPPLRNECIAIFQKSPVQEEKQDSVEKIEKYIMDKARNGADLGDLGREIHIAFPNFKYKELGYSKLSKYIESLSQVKIITDDGNKNYVVLK